MFVQVYSEFSGPSLQHLVRYENWTIIYSENLSVSAQLFHFNFSPTHALCTYFVKKKIVG